MQVQMPCPAPFLPRPSFEAGGFNDLDMLVVGLDGMTPYGIVESCPKHVAACKPGSYVSREQWGRVGVQ
jgi:hypothetical protein